MDDIAKDYKKQLLMVPAPLAKTKKETLQKFIEDIEDLRQQANSLESKFKKDELKMKDEEQPLIEMQATAQQLEKRGLKVQDKSKKALERTEKRVNEMHGFADEGL